MSSPFEGVQLLFLAFALVSAGATAMTLDTGNTTGSARLAGTLVLVALGRALVHRLPPRRLPAVVGAAGGRRPVRRPASDAGEPFIPLFGLVFRSLYGGWRVASLRYLLWMGALLGAHAHLGATHIRGDLAKALGTALVPPIMQALGGALRSSEASQRRLRSLVQNSTDVMTVVGADLLVRWQAESIRGALGVDARTIVDEPILELVHPDDRAELARLLREPGRRGAAR